ncbi:Pycsar system effector family protein [Neisseria sp. Ec49-e6-T10]|uniref:Pycsar system effector family protein n=1 Tax=Neisseria sp. Ec49-e6-T10 TaxID=3140744 RepID=UPI003EBF641B
MLNKNKKDQKDIFLTIPELNILLDRTIDFIKTCENKVAIVLSIYGVILAILFSSENIQSVKNATKSILVADRCIGILFIIFFIISLLILILGIGTLLAVLFANTKCLEYQSKIFFNHIATNSSWKQYKEVLLEYSEENHKDDLISQIHRNSTICSIKFKRYQTGLKISLIGFSSFILMWVVSMSV